MARAFDYRLVIGATATMFIGLCLAILPNYPGSALFGIFFVASGVTFVVLCYAKPSSFFLLSVSGFLAAGFLAKAVAHFFLGIDLIEPIGEFSGEWDDALSFATSGFVGGSMATVLCWRFPTFSQLERIELNPLGRKLTILALGATVAIALGVYALNYEFHILKIGYPLGIPIDPRVYAVLSFIITWGSLLGTFCLAVWIIEANASSPWPMICLASLVGAMATVTMGSRIQLLLYLLAATLVVFWRVSDVRRWWHVGASFGFAIVLVATAHVLVSIERRYDFVVEPTMSAAEPAPKLEAVKRSYQDEGLLIELRNLAVMRWVGLEGPMVMAGSSEKASMDLFLEGISEDPAAGIDGIYQLLSGDQYGTVEYYTFLTLPGPVGIASYSGNHLVVAGFLFVLVLAGHTVEWMMAKFTRNIGAAAVAGVSTAYITVQMGFPWTYFIFLIELTLAGIVLGLIRIFLNKVSSVRRQPSHRSF